MKLALKITPQRSTQYTNMVETLAIPELLISPLRQAITSAEPVVLAGQGYVLTTLDDSQMSSPEQLDVLYRLGAISEVYEYFECIGAVQGPLLKPLEPRFTPFVPREIVETRRYKGKTNELFTHVLLNIAIFSGSYSEQYMQRLRMLDPLAGGATTLFQALIMGYDAFGIETTRHDVETTAVFVRQFLNSEHVRYKEIDERRRKAGQRYQFEVGPARDTRFLVLVHGDAKDADMHLREVPGGPRVHAIVGDLPYGIQHFGEIAGLLSKALPVWEQMLFPGGTLALAWNATHIERAVMVEFIERHSHLCLLNEPPYTQLAHTVDRVIKRRDVVVGVKSS
ncbi:MAG TPA: hypothetical protein VH593_19405 [Ktedonobacteraceae bacterium]|jgi:hypothetical protein